MRVPELILDVIPLWPMPLRLCIQSKSIELRCVVAKPNSQPSCPIRWQSINLGGRLELLLLLWLHLYSGSSWRSRHIRRHMRRRIAGAYQFKYPRKWQLEDIQFNIALNDYMVIRN